VGEQVDNLAGQINPVSRLEEKRFLFSQQFAYNRQV
jgi:hypothetical protein